MKVIIKKYKTIPKEKLAGMNVQDMDAIIFCFKFEIPAFIIALSVTAVYILSKHINIWEEANKVYKLFST